MSDKSRASTDSAFSRRSWVGMTNVVSVDDGDHPVYVPFSHSTPFFKLKPAPPSVKSKHRDTPVNLKEGTVKRLLTYQKPEADTARDSSHQCCVACDGSCSTSGTFSSIVASNYHQVNEDTEQNLYAAADEENVYDVTWTGEHLENSSLENINHGRSNDTTCLVKAADKPNIQPGEGNYMLMDSADPQITSLLKKDGTSSPSLILKGEPPSSEDFSLRSENDQPPNESSTDNASSWNREAPSYYVPTHTAPRVPSCPVGSWTDAKQVDTSTQKVISLMNMSTETRPTALSKHGPRSSDYMNIYDEPRQVSGSAIDEHSAAMIPDRYNRISTISKNHEYETLSNQNEYTYIENTPSYTNRDIISDAQRNSVIHSQTNTRVHSALQYQEPDVVWPPSKSKTLTLDVTKKVEDRVRSPDLDSGIGLAEESTCDNAHYCEMDIQQNVAASSTDASMLSELQQRFQEQQSKSEDLSEVYDIPRTSLTLDDIPNVTETSVCDTSNRDLPIGPTSTTPQQHEQKTDSSKLLQELTNPQKNSLCPRLVDEQPTENQSLVIKRTKTPTNDTLQNSPKPVQNELSKRQSLILIQIGNSRELKKTTKAAIIELNPDITAELFNENNEVEQLQSLLPSVGKLELNKLRCLLSKK